MKETTKHNLAILCITIFIGGSLYLFISYINPLLKQVKEIRQGIEEEKTKLEEVKKYRQKSDELIQIYLNLKEEVEKIDLALPEDAQSAQIIAVLNKIFRDNNVIPGIITFSEGSKDEYKYLVIDTSFNSTYEVLKRISFEIEKELRLMDIEEVSITNNLSLREVTPIRTTRTTRTTIPRPPTLSVEMSILTYYLPKENIISSEEINF